MGNFKRMDVPCYKCGKIGCAQAVDNDRQFYCHRFKETYFMNNAKGQGGHYDRETGIPKVAQKKKKESSTNSIGLFSSLLYSDNHYDDD